MPGLLTNRFNAADLIEQTLRGLIAFVFRLPTTIVLCLFRPRLIASYAIRQRPRYPVVHPYTFLCTGALAFNLVSSEIDPSQPMWDAKSRLAAHRFLQELSPTQVLIDSIPVVLYTVFCAGFFALLLIQFRRERSSRAHAWFGFRFQAVINIAAYSTGLVGWVVAIGSYLLSWLVSHPDVMPWLSFTYRSPATMGMLMTLSGVPVLLQAWRITSGKVTSIPGLGVRIFFGGSILMVFVIGLIFGSQWYDARTEETPPPDITPNFEHLQVIPTDFRYINLESENGVQLEMAITNTSNDTVVINQQVQINWHLNSEELYDLISRWSDVTSPQPLSTQHGWVIPPMQTIVMKVRFVGDGIYLPASNTKMNLIIEVSDERTLRHPVERYIGAASDFEKR